MRYLLDTSICVFFLRGKLKLDELIHEKGRENCFISEMTVIELRYGAENSDNPLKSNKAVDNFLSGFQLFQFMVQLEDTPKKKYDLKNLANPCTMSLTF